MGKSQGPTGPPTINYNLCCPERLTIKSAYPTTTHVPQHSRRHKNSRWWTHACQNNQISTELAEIQALIIHRSKTDGRTHRTRVLRGTWWTRQSPEHNRNLYFIQSHLGPITWYRPNQYRRQDHTIQISHQSKRATGRILPQTREVPRLCSRCKCSHLWDHYGNHRNQVYPPIQKPHSVLAQMAYHVNKATNMATVESTLDRCFQQTRRHLEAHQRWVFY